MVNGKFENYLCTFVANNQSSFTTLVNVGANVGIYPCIALQNNYENVLAIEPNRSNFKIMKANIRRNGWAKKVELLNVGCAGESGTGILFGRNTGASLIPFWEGNIASKGVEIDTVTLDSLLMPFALHKKTLVIIDVEGFEFEVIRGSTLAMESTGSFSWLIEVSLYRSIDGKESLTPGLENFFSKFLNLGYSVLVYDSAWRQLSEEEITFYTSGEVFWPALPFLFQK